MSFYVTMITQWARSKTENSKQKGGCHASRLAPSASWSNLRNIANPVHSQALTTCHTV